MNFMLDPNHSLQAALEYASLGWHLVLLHSVNLDKSCSCSAGKNCKSAGKHPRLANWPETATTDEAVISQWFDDYDNPNIGILLGERSNIIDIECDTEEAEARLLEVFGGEMIACPTYTSGRGKHRLFRYRLGLPGPNVAVYKPGNIGLELRTGYGDKGAQSVFPPSRHMSGGRYLWLPGLSPAEIDPPHLPEDVITRLWQLDRMERPDKPKERAPRKYEQALNGVAEGDRHSSALSYVGKVLRDCPINESAELEIRRQQCHAWNATNRPPLTDDEIDRIFHDVLVMEQKRREAARELLEHPTGINEAPDDPHRLARVFLNQTAIDETIAFVSWREEVFVFREGAYHSLPSNEFRAMILSSIKDEFDRINAEQLAAYEASGDSQRKRPVCLKVTRSLANSVSDAISSQIVLASDTSLPAWIGKDAPPFDLSETLSFKNGTLYLPKYLDESAIVFIPPTPKIFITTSIGCDFDPMALMPKRWNEFLDSIWPNDRESQETLGEMFGYVLSRDTSQQKLFAIVGAPRSGKGTIAKILEHLLGNGNTASPTLASLSTNFGLSPLLHKALAVVSDARLSGRADAQLIAERLLSISGEDALTIDRKYMSPVTVRLSTRVLILSNELPRIEDASGALASRFIILQTTKSFLGNENTNLLQELRAELPGILRWSLDGLRRLRNRGHFIQPEASAQAFEHLQSLGSSITAFVNERCVLDERQSVPCAELFRVWRRWHDQQGRRDFGDVQEMGRKLFAAFPRIRTIQPRRPDGSRPRVYVGIGLAREGDQPAIDSPSWNARERVPVGIVSNAS